MTIRISERRSNGYTVASDAVAQPMPASAPAPAPHAMPAWGPRNMPRLSAMISASTNALASALPAPWRSWSSVRPASRCHACANRIGLNHTPPIRRLDSAATATARMLTLAMSERIPISVGPPPAISAQAGDPATQAGGSGREPAAGLVLIERSEMGGEDFAGGAGGEAPREIDDRWVRAAGIPAFGIGIPRLTGLLDGMEPAGPHAAGY